MKTRPHVLAAAVAATVVATGVAGCASTTSQDVDHWTGSPGSTSVTLVVLTGPSDKAIRGEVVSESSTQVVVAATVRLSRGSQAAVGVWRYVDVHLKAPIGSRAVVNRDGSAVPRQS